MYIYIYVFIYIYMVEEFIDKRYDNTEIKS